MSALALAMSASKQDLSNQLIVEDEHKSVQVIEQKNQPQRVSDDDVQDMFTELKDIDDEEIRVDVNAAEVVEQKPSSFALSPRAARTSRFNGFEKPFHWQQIASWILHPLLLVLFLALIYPWIVLVKDEQFNLKVKRGLAFGYFYLWELVFFLGYLSTKTDSRDSFVKARFIAKEDFNAASVSRMRQTICAEENQDWCDFCLWVVHADSYHCKACNKCTSKMDVGLG
jgi:hypothetical protein